MGCRVEGTVCMGCRVVGCMGCKGVGMDSMVHKDCKDHKGHMVCKLEGRPEGILGYMGCCKGSLDVHMVHTDLKTTTSKVSFRRGKVKPARVIKQCLDIINKRISQSCLRVNTES